MSKNIRACAHCGKEFNPSPRIKSQAYCGSATCRKARRAAWQRRKNARDPDYGENQKRCQKEWQKKNPEYYRHYRKTHPEYTRRNRLLQEVRNARMRKSEKSRLIAKMDSIAKACYSRRSGLFRLIPQGHGAIAKMDSIRVKLVPI